ncbi:hypothetical protein O181_077062 [Austropuccinia psidii MF-1]|uniref:SRP54-type proteins GTP-binding domain-containing protein n=1 Tax=Austropuccinia psidii MF-1 TaxID=1389203 RepID=A0A9Q3FI05_9BASI|nr:hypothetical protein [Austropuccinia psidii MF-1]
MSTACAAYTQLATKMKQISGRQSIKTCPQLEQRIRANDNQEQVPVDVILDHVHTFHRGGLVLWSKSFVPTPLPIRSTIRFELIEERSDGHANEHHLQEIQVGSCSLQWNLSNEFGLVFVEAYQSILQLSYISDLLESIKSLFISLYTPALDTYLKSWIVPENSLQGGFKALFTGWDHSFNQLLKDVERMSSRRHGGGLQKVIELEKAASKKQISYQSTSETESTKSDSVPPIKPSIGKKESQKWTDGKLTAQDISKYDFSESFNDQTSSGQDSALIDLASLTPKSDLLKKFIYESLKPSLTKILTPHSNVDIMMEIQHKQQQQRTYLAQANGPMAPYVMTFAGVNGVGKSTNLSKVAFWLLQNQLHALVAACDTFQSRAVKQLRVHVGNLRKLGGVMDERYTNIQTKTGENKCKLNYTKKGYGKDAVGIAKAAIQYGE